MEKVKERPPRKISTSVTLGPKDVEKAEEIARIWKTNVSDVVRRLIQQVDMESVN